MLAWMVLLPLLVAPVSWILWRSLRGISQWMLALVLLALPVLLLSYLPDLRGGFPVVEIAPWVSNLGLALHFRLDALAMLLALLASSTSILVVIHTGLALADDPRGGGVLGYLLLLLGGLMGLALAGNMLTLLLFWEVTSVALYMLVAHRHEEAAVRAGAQQVLLLNLTGGILLLAGLALLGHAAQNVGVAPDLAYQFRELLAVRGSLLTNPLVMPAALLILLGSFHKAAQMPFHFWLPRTLDAPGPVLAYMLSTLLLGGIYLPARLHALFSGTWPWHFLLMAAGLLGLVVGAVQAWQQHDMRRLLMAITVSHIGGGMLLLGLGATGAVLVLLLTHTFAVGALVLLTNNIARITGTHDIRQPGQLARRMPVTAWLSLLAGLTLAGMPPLMGFVAHEALFAAVWGTPLLAAPGARTLVLTLVLLALALLVAATGRLLYPVFLGARATPASAAASEAEPGLLLAPALLASLALFFSMPGAVQRAFNNLLISPAASLMAGRAVTVELSPWQGIGLPFLASMFVLLIGAALTYAEPQLTRLLPTPRRTISGSRFYQETLDAVQRSANLLLPILQNNKIPTYVAILFIVWLGLFGPFFASYGLTNLTLPGPAEMRNNLLAYEALVAALIVVGVLVAVQATSRLAGLLGITLAGGAMALWFVLLGAPGLALIQFLAVAIITTFLLLVFSALPSRFIIVEPEARQMRDALIAWGGGLLMTGLTYIALTSAPSREVARYYLEESLPRGRGENPVSVVLLNFRSIDTLGQIVALLLCMLGVYGLLRLRRRQRSAPVRQPANGSVTPSNGGTQGRPQSESQEKEVSLPR